MKHDDLSELLRSWPFEPGRINARVIEGTDERPKLQVRIELGVLQMELEGRPDGLHPDGHPSLLDLYQSQLHQHIRRSGSELGFVITPDACRSLREEAVQYYHRYVALFSIGDYAGVVRDTKRNLTVLDFCRTYAAEAEDRTVLEQLRPSVIMMRTRGEAEIAVGQRLPKQALACIDRGLDEIRTVFEAAGHAASFEQANEVLLLRGMRDVLIPKLPASQRAELLERLQSALDTENYELAAILRDELRLLGD